MGNELHLYTFGVDPYVIQMGDVAFFIHQGEPASPTPPARPPGGDPEIFKTTRLNSPYENYIMAPQRADDVGAILRAQGADAIDLGVALTHESEYSRGNQLAALFDGLSQHGSGDVSIHVVSLDHTGHLDPDG